MSDVQVPSASFRCHHCQKQMTITGSYWYQNELYLYGTCHNCEEDIPFKIEDLYAFFLDRVLVKGSKSVN